MKIMYSKKAIKSLLDMSEEEVAAFLRDIRRASSDPPTTSVTSIPGYSDRRKLFKSGERYGVFKRAIFKGHSVIYVMDVLTKEELS